MKFLFKIFARCPVEPIQAATTSSGKEYFSPPAIFSPVRVYDFFIAVKQLEPLGRV